MPALTEISKRIKIDTLWKDVFHGNYAAAKSIATNIHLIHVSGHYISFDSLFGSTCELPTSDDDRSYCSQSTIETEALIGIKPSVYFYAGRACQEFGTIALAFPANCENDHSGSVSPYDTGGFHHPKAKYINWNIADDTVPIRVEFTLQSLIDLKDWRKIFAKYLAIYFNPLLSYWNTLPWKEDPEGLFDSRNDNHWRAWTFEVRFYENESILNAEAWCASEDQSEILWQQVEDLSLATPDDHPLRVFLETVPEIESRGTPFYCEIIERWVQDRLGI